MIRNQHLRTLLRLCAVLLFVIIMLACGESPITDNILRIAHLHQSLSAGSLILARTVLLLVVLLTAWRLVPQMPARVRVHSVVINKPYRG